jgi:hypothetical protein
MGRMLVSSVREIDRRVEFFRVKVKAGRIASDMCQPALAAPEAEKGIFSIHQWKTNADV